ncbi:Uncharacterized membrane protein YfcA [Formivibrio citricus]|uniref:Probable membrane transporter protein n=1 Tax=Formivibrio citricus TaxID=83765 RepID=A0A1I4YHY0_9NEIS|nr:sulfite exporter TauE/SafE family protein [Formivibrio citricus]SFN37443.1 Uncharacterized membrane protein YfcA [Formivibrio citricus]
MLYFSAALVRLPDSATNKNALMEWRLKCNGLIMSKCAPIKFGKIQERIYSVRRKNATSSHYFKRAGFPLRKGWLRGMRLSSHFLWIKWPGSKRAACAATSGCLLYPDWLSCVGRWGGSFLKDMFMLGQMLVDFACGLLLGVTGGMLGIAGGIIAIPMLGFMYGMNQHLAQGTTLIMIVPSVLIGFIRYRQRNEIRFKPIFAMCISATITSYFAARIATWISHDNLQKAFAIFLLGLAVYYAVQSRSKSGSEPPAKTLSAKYYALLGMLSGIMSGIFAVGGGLVVVPLLISLFGFKQTQAQGTALALVIPGSITALFAYTQAGYVNWGTGIPLALGGVISVSWGVALAHKLKTSYLRMAFSSVMVGVAALMLVGFVV